MILREVTTKDYAEIKKLFKRNKLKMINFDRWNNLWLKNPFLKKKKIDKIIFKYLKPQKNKPCLDFLKKNLVKGKNNVFIYKKNTRFVLPQFLKIV